MTKLAENLQAEKLEKEIETKNFLGKPDLSYGWAKLNNEYLALLAYKKYRIKIF